MTFNEDLESEVVMLTKSEVAFCTKSIENVGKNKISGADLFANEAQTSP